MAVINLLQSIILSAPILCCCYQKKQKSCKHVNTAAWNCRSSYLRNKTVHVWCHPSAARSSCPAAVVLIHLSLGSITLPERKRVTGGRTVLSLCGCSVLTRVCMYVCICLNMFPSCGLIGCTSYLKLASCVFLPWTSTTQSPNRNLTTCTAAVNLFWMGEKNNTFSVLTVLTWTWVSHHGSLCAWKIRLSLSYCAINLNDVTQVSLTNWKMRFLKKSTAAL